MLDPRFEVRGERRQARGDAQVRLSRVLHLEVRHRRVCGVAVGVDVDMRHIK